MGRLCDRTAVTVCGLVEGAEVDCVGHRHVDGPAQQGPVRHSAEQGTLVAADDAGEVVDAGGRQVRGERVPQQAAGGGHLHVAHRADQVLQTAGGGEGAGVR